ncbi:Polynucleotide 5'-hydroxyl-kinase grc3 [Puccinia graminis f. sp. tritici]|uniref:Polynucleotide 5'-hydroxyl-kinase GRC3 n=1 Tax=Puccinia graminis f. sp. tritici TaxID=56615 RepID=A0A5B0QM54_PUCGR|nr:Polynucleotide 5'-hydroxyl-kinase grc3 [Puccinia graminis f. sp. tritici]
MTISAIAARRLAAAQQQQQQQHTTPQHSAPPSPQSELLEEEPELELELELEQQHQQKHQQQPKTRYFTAATPPQPAPSSKSPKRRHQPTRSGFIDPESISDWNPIIQGTNQNYRKTVDQNQNQISIIGLKTGQNLIPHGTLQLRILHGQVELMGSEIAAPTLEPINLFAPPSHPLPIITPKPSSLPSSHSTPPDHHLPLDPTKFDAIVELQDLDCGIQALDELWSSNGNKRPIWSSPSPNPPHSIHGQTWSIVLSPTPDLARLRLPSSWASTLSSLPSRDEVIEAGRAEIYFIEGPKSTGKSTFSTLLINSLLNSFKSVALLDLDPGQPLLTPPTLVSLHTLNSPILGPSFCRLLSPHQPSSHLIYIGHTTPKDCPTRYTEACLELFNLYTNLQSDLSTCLSTNKRRRRGRNNQIGTDSDHHSKRTDQIPLVINTMGWTRGLGQDLLNQLLQTIQPTQIFSFNERPLVADIVPSERHLTLEPIGPTPLSLRLTPADCRVLAIVSYMYSTPSPVGSMFINQWEFQYPLWARRPFEVRPDRIQLPDHPDFNQGHLGHVLNGGLIGLLDRSQGSWIGFGLVRAIDPNRRTIHLLTPAYPIAKQNNPTEYEFVKYSEPELPLICSLSDGTVPYLEKESLGNSSTAPLTIGSEKKRVRRNVQRRSQISR